MPDSPTPRIDGEALARNVRDHHGPGFESLVLALTAERDAAERRAVEAERLLRGWLNGSMTIEDMQELESETAALLAKLDQEREGVR